jgi:arginase
MGPIQFIQNGIETILQNSGHSVNVTTVESSIPFPTEIGTTFDVNRNLAKRVLSAVNNNRFPVVLAGNCNSCVGTIAGLDSKQLGIIWFDAHGDFNTPETTTTGFLDGMGLAMATGRCWKPLLSKIHNFNPVPESCIVHVGSRDLDPEERRMFIEAKIPLLVANPIDENEIIAALKNTLLNLKGHVEGVYLHIDMDVLETKQGKPNHLAVPGGLPPHIVEEAIQIIKKHFKIEACTIASYDPAFDEGNSVLHAGIRILKAIVEAENKLT